MNEKIKELAEQFRMNFSINGEPQDGIHWDDVDEFAQLIVKECLNNMNNCAGDLDFAIWKTEKDFGVEE
jgi:hypothetical protein